MLYRAVIEVYVSADSEEEADMSMALVMNHAAELEAVEDVYYTSLEEYDDDPQCVCGVYKSEHALCGCGEWERRR